MHGDVPLGAGADEVAVTGEEAVGPVGAALPLEQPAQHGERLGRPPGVELGPVVPADDEVRPLAVADLVVDDPAHDRGVLLVGGLEPAAVDEADRDVGQRGQQLGERHLGLDVDVDDGERGAVVVGLEPPLGHLPERYGEQPVEPAPVVGRPVLQRHVHQRADLGPRTADQGDRRGVPQPDDRPGLPRQDLLERGTCGQGGGGHGGNATNGGRSQDRHARLVQLGTRSGPRAPRTRPRRPE